MRLVIVISLILSYIILDPAYLLDPGVSNLCKACSYFVFHGNILHLFLNCLSVWTLFRPERSTKCRDLILGYIVSCLVWYLSSKQILGFSNILFCVVGMRTPGFDHSWWRSPECRIYLGTMIAMTLLPNVSALTHIFSFAAGVLLAMFNRSIDTLDHDIRRAGAGNR